MRYALGVDLGTTYSAAAVAEDGRVETFTLGIDSPAIPSVVVLRADGEVLVGEAAERRAYSEPTRTAREFKRRLGDPAPLVLGGTPYGAEALMARLLRSIVDAVTERQGGPPSVIEITHPASYGPFKKDLLREMVRQADLDSAEFLSEPEAAAINYTERDRLEPGEIVAVYDFGGGTFDAAILRKTAGGFELLGQPEGMERLGGIDFDQAIFSHVDEATGGLVGQADGRDPEVRSALARLRASCRAAKESLSMDTDATIPVVLPGLHTDVRLTRPELEAMIRPRIGETVAALERAVRSASLEMSQVSRILLVGGSSRIPLVMEMVAAATGRPTAVDAHPKFAIALGAARAGLAKLSPTVGVSAPARPAIASAGSAPVPDATDNRRLIPEPGPFPGPVPSARPPDRSGGTRIALVLGVGVVVLAIGAFALFGRSALETASGSPSQSAGPASSSQTSGSETSSGPTAASSPESPGAAPSSPASSTEPGSVPGSAPLIGTVVGGLAQGNSGDGGRGPAARIGRSAAAAVGPDGTLYVADQQFGTIRTLSAGSMATFATGLLQPNGIAVDSAGNVYVADAGADRVVRISASGGIETFAGQEGIPDGDGDGGAAVAAHLSDPFDVAVDGAGNVYIADRLNNRIRRVNPAGIISTVAGTGATGFAGDGGPAIEASLNGPRGIAVDQDGNLYIADTENYRVRKVDLAGQISTIGGTGENREDHIYEDRSALENQMPGLEDVVVDASGNVYATVWPARVVVRIDPAGELVIVAGGGDSEADGIPATEATWGEAWGLAIDPGSGDLYIATGPRVRQVPGVARPQ